MNKCWSSYSSALTGNLPVEGPPLREAGTGRVQGSAGTQGPGGSPGPRTPLTPVELPAPPTPHAPSGLSLCVSCLLSTSHSRCRAPPDARPLVAGHPALPCSGPSSPGVKAGTARQLRRPEPEGTAVARHPPPRGSSRVLGRHPDGQGCREDPVPRARPLSDTPGSDPTKVQTMIPKGFLQPWQVQQGGRIAGGSPWPRGCLTLFSPCGFSKETHGLALPTGGYPEGGTVHACPSQAPAHAPDPHARATAPLTWGPGGSLRP